MTTVAESEFDVAVIGGGGGVPFMIGPIAERNTGIRMAAVVPATDFGGHSGELRKQHTEIAPPGDAVKSIGATALQPGFSLSEMKERTDNGSVGNNMFLERYLRACEEGVGDPNQTALNQLAEDAGSRAAVYFATRPSHLIVVGENKAMIASNEVKVSNLKFTPSNISEYAFSIEGDPGFTDAVLESGVLDARNVLIAPSHPGQSIAPALYAARHLDEGARANLSARTTMVIGTENPWNMPGLTVADQYTFVQRVSGVSPARIAIGNSSVPLNTKDLPETVQNVVKIQEYDGGELQNQKRMQEVGSPTDHQKPTEVYHPDFVPALLDRLDTLASQLIVA